MPHTLPGSASYVAQNYTACIQKIEQTPSGIVLVWLDLGEGHQSVHQPGQYLQLKLANEWSFFSIASLAGHGALLELHIQTNQHEKIQFLLAAFADQTVLEIKYPFGVVSWHSGFNNGLFICRGTGFAPAKALIEAALGAKSGTHIHLCWEGEYAQDVYFLPWLKSQLKQYPLFSATLYAANIGDGLIEGNDRLEHKLGAIVDDLTLNQASSLPQEHLNQRWIYLCASPAQVYSWVDELQKHQVLLENMSSDAFEYAPR